MVQFIVFAKDNFYSRFAHLQRVFYGNVADIRKKVPYQKGLLFCVCGEKCVSKVILVLIVGGGAPAVTRGRRAIPKKSRSFDSTMGYLGEDVDSN